MEWEEATHAAKSETDLASKVQGLSNTHAARLANYLTNTSCIRRDTGKTRELKTFVIMDTEIVFPRSFLFPTHIDRGSFDEDF